MKRRVQKIAKHLIDVGASVTGLILLAIPFAIIALAVAIIIGLLAIAPIVIAWQVNRSNR